MENTPQRRGLRILIGLAGLFSVFALAWLWQERNIEQSRRIRDTAPDVLAKAGGAEGLDQPEPSPLAHLDPGWGRIVLGRPSGSEPTARPEPIAPPADPAPRALDQPDSPTVEPPDGPAPAASKWPADQELIVRPGQSLSKIIAGAYGRSTPDLVNQLATYNGMENANKLREGQKLLIPTKDKLLELVP